MMRGGRQRGVIYLALLLMVALVGGLSAVGLRVARTAQVRSDEAQLLAIGLEFRRALRSYAEATPNGLPPAPETLQELLRDPRHPGVLRHLRRLYLDPFSGKAEWGLVRGLDQRIVGVHSLSHSETFKRRDFPAELELPEDLAYHDAWVFGVSPVLPDPNSR